MGLPSAWAVQVPGIGMPPGQVGYGQGLGGVGFSSGSFGRTLGSGGFVGSQFGFGIGVGLGSGGAEEANAADKGGVMPATVTTIATRPVRMRFFMMFSWLSIDGPKPVATQSSRFRFH
jgi:hypothetical protein